ncbi:MAG: carboxypeptidase-like regulatory domain-containing protein [Candidatus Caldatribacteriota bacterium]|nr:carboxypeptidase-like regulatory domain-containing protein [Candidatus Caldatribacteriota bacterium]
MKGNLFQIVFRLSVVIIGISFLLFLGGGCTSPPVSIGSVQGVITDNQSSEPLAGVLISAGNVTTTSDASGNYILNKVPVGDREITAVIEDYSSQSETVEIIENEITELDFQLMPLSQENQRVVMVELFVAPTCPNCPKAKDATAQLLEQYGFDKLVVLEEYGWNVEPNYTGWATAETIDRFKWYTNSLGISRHTPDAYFNGLNQSVHYNKSSYNNYKAAIDEELAKAPKINILASSSVDIANLTVSINGSIENISSEDLTDLIVGAMIYEDSVYLGSEGKNVNHVVRDIIISEEIISFTPGAIQEINLSSEILNNVKNMNNIHVIVYVQAPNSSTKEILQAAYVE